MQQSKVSPTTLLAVALTAVALAPSCGARAEDGNTGSETHWLQSCDTNSECGSYSCLCGICTRACDSDEECTGQAECAAKGELRTASECSSRVPARVCAAAPPGDAGVGDFSMDPNPDGSVDPNVDPNVTPNVELGALCDGSDDVRLSYQYGGAGGPQAYYYAFYDAYGSRFLVIDGRCDFWVSTRQGLVAIGNAAGNPALDAYESAHFGKLAPFTRVRVPSDCFDAGGGTLWDPSGLASGTPCGAEQQAPPGWLEAMTDASTLLDALLADATPSSGPLRANFGAAESSQPSAGDWPLARSPEPMITDVPQMGANSSSDPDVGVLFPEGPEAEALRALRSESSASFVFTYTTEAGAMATALVDTRDELPPRVKVALTRPALEAFAEGFGETCDNEEACDYRLVCTDSEDRSERSCNVCGAPDQEGFRCDDNADCCPSLFCCVDCPNSPDTCVASEDPCGACLERGGAWHPNTDECLATCEPGTLCFGDECPAACDTDSCGTCFDLESCWVAGCEWDAANDSCIGGAEPPDPLCQVDATDDSMPGVIVHLESDRCTFAPGEGGQFRYSVTLNQSLDFTIPDESECSEYCGNTDELSTYVLFIIDGDSATYCPTCDLGCCAPRSEMAMSLDAQEEMQTINWPGLQWTGPSDTGIEPDGEFPEGDFTAQVRLNLPGLGAVTAELPIQVREP